jgi:ABC-type transport system involved in multi-copper enzyme maturation permease subunit
MKNLWTVTRRELNEWRPMVWVSTALLLLALVLPWMPGMSRYEAVDVRASGSILFGLVLAIGLSLVLGISLLGTEISQGRLGFYLSQPLHAAEIWFGKILAGTLVLVGSVLLVQLPAFLSEGVWIDLVSNRGPALADNVWVFVAMLLLGSLLILLLTHTIGLGLRSRNPWLAVTAFGLAATTFLTSKAVLGYLDLLNVFAGHALLRDFPRWLGTVVVAWLLAGWLQLRQGGSEVNRGYRWLTIVGWSLTVLASAGFAAKSHWMQGGQVDSLGSIFVQAAPAGPWTAVRGINPRNGLQAGFLLNTETGASTLVAPLLLRDWDWIAFSSSGETAYVLVYNQEIRLSAWSLSETASRRALPPLAFDSSPRFAAGNGRLVVQSEDELFLFQEEPWRLIGSTEVPFSGGQYPRYSVLPNGNVRAFVVEKYVRDSPNQLGSTVRAWDFDGANLVEKTGWTGAAIEGWGWPEKDGRAFRFISEGTVHRLAPDEEPNLRALSELDARWGHFVAHLPNFTLVAALQGNRTRIARRVALSSSVAGSSDAEIEKTPSARMEEETSITVPGRVVSFKERPDASAALLTTQRAQAGGGVATRFYRVEVDPSGNPTAREIAFSKSPLYASGNDVFASPQEIVKLDFDAGTLRTVLRTQ